MKMRKFACILRLHSFWPSLAGRNRQVTVNVDLVEAARAVQTDL